MTDTQDIEARLRASSENAAKASQYLAEQKSMRNRAAGDENATYRGLAKEQTLEWLAADEIARLQEENKQLTRANSTRADYPLYCGECGRAHILDTSLPSEIWNKIASPNDVLCTICIDRRLSEAGLSAEAEFYFVGDALQSKLYNSSTASEARATAAEARLAEVEKVVEVARALKFAAYPAHGSGFVITVTGGNINDLQSALDNLKDTRP